MSRKLAATAAVLVLGIGVGMAVGQEMATNPDPCEQAKALAKDWTGVLKEILEAETRYGDAVVELVRAVAGSAPVQHLETLEEFETAFRSLNAVNTRHRNFTSRLLRLVEDECFRTVGVVLPRR